MLFIFALVAPTIVVIASNSADISIIFSFPEEEENGHGKKLKVYFSSFGNNFDLDPSRSKNRLNYCNIRYSTPFLIIFSPPPDLAIS
ncbi:hypothetical protein [Portibacter lacus]|nr:hypothetical protein [Portibacter lacus]